jgi:cell division protein FtsI/penicillin-binding protein 2
MSSQTANRYGVPLWRTLVVYGILLAVVTGITYRLFTLQVVGNETWRVQSVENYTSEISIPALRGIIYDRNGYILARNIASYNVVITPAGLPDDEADIQRIYREVSDLTGVPVGGPVTEETLSNAKLFSACLPGPSIADMVALGDSLAPYTPVKISCNISEELARVIRERSVDWPGVSVEIEPIRDYPTGSLTANVVGFLGPIPEALSDAYEQREGGLRGRRNFARRYPARRERGASGAERCGRTGPAKPGAAQGARRRQQRGPDHRHAPAKSSGSSAGGRDQLLEYVLQPDPNFQWHRHRDEPQDWRDPGDGLLPDL